MAIVPKRIDTNKQVAQPAQAPEQSISTNADMFGMSAARQLVSAGADMSAVGDKFNEIRGKVLSREDVIKQARSERAFNDEAFKAFNKFKSEGDAMDPESIKKYNTGLQQTMQKTLDEWTGTIDGRAKLQAKLEGIYSMNSASAQEFVDGVQRQEVLTHLGDRMKGITAKVIENPSYLSQAFLDADKVLDELAPGLDADEELAQAEAIRSQIVLSSLDSLTNAGAYDEAAELVREHPSFLEQLSPELQRSTMQKIAEGQQRRRRAVEDVQNQVAARELALGRALTPDERTEVILGRNPNAMLTEAGKHIQDRKKIEDEFGEDSEEMKIFESLHESSKPKKGTPLEQALSARDRALTKFGEGSEEHRLAQAQVDKLDPQYEIRKEKIAKLPKAQASIRSAERDLTTLENKALEALEIIYQTKFSNMQEAISAVNSSMETEEGGFWDSMQALVPMETESRNLGNAIDTIKALNLVSTLTEMRQNSPTGGAMGSLSDREGALLSAIKGTLDIATPKQTAQTLANILENAAATKEDRRAAFMQDFGDFLPDNEGNTAVGTQNTRASTTDAGEPIYDVDLSGAGATPPATPQDQPAAGGPAPEASSDRPAGREDPLIAGQEIVEMNAIQLNRMLELEDLSDEEAQLIDTRLRQLGF